MKPISHSHTIKSLIEDTLKTDHRLWYKEQNEHQYLNQTRLIDLIYKTDKDIIQLLFKEPTLKKHFFVQLQTDSYVFKTNEFHFFIEEHKLFNSYTDYANRIGLADGKKFLNDTEDVVLNFPFKDCLLQGGQSTEEGVDIHFEKNKKGEYLEKKTKREEIFFNQILAKDEIDRLKDEKALVKWRRHSKGGSEGIKGLKRDRTGLIRENMLIKGNNLLALYSLRRVFAGKVKLIYIDPPYNTGNDGFKYNDKFNHSTWLVFMKNRLEVARELLREDGAIFVQCDDNEQAYLKVLMDEVFGRENFISNSIVIINRGGRDYGGIAKTHEYLIIYGKSKLRELNFIEEKNKVFKYADDLGRFDIRELRNRNVLFNEENCPNLCYSIFVNPNGIDKNELFEISLDKKEGFIEVMPLKSQGIQTVWRWGKEKLLQNLNREVKAKKKRDGSYMIVQKYRKTTKRQRSIWDEKEFVNERGTQHIKSLFNGRVFSYPKSEYLIARVVELSTKESDIVLDYHLGSGTTAAVAHKMGRQYIGIEQMDYIESIALERLKKVIDGESGGISKSVEWQGGGSVVYCELAKWNEKAKEEINACGSLEKLEQLFDHLYDTYFLKYTLRMKEFKEKMIKDRDFRRLSLEEHKSMFLRMLDLNHLYVCRSEMEDSRYSLECEDIALTKTFYGR